MADHQPDIARTEVEVLSAATNAWVVRTTDRKFPAVVLQGDTLFTMFREAERLFSGLRVVEGIDSKLIESAQELRDMLEERLRHYETVLHEHGIGLPYNR